MRLPAAPLTYAADLAEQHLVEHVVSREKLHLDLLALASATRGAFVEPSAWNNSFQRAREREREREKEKERAGRVHKYEYEVDDCEYRGE